MRIKTLCRVEDSSLVRLQVSGEENARELAEQLKARPGVMGCRFRGMTGTDAAIFALVMKLERDVVADVPPEVATQLIALGYANEAAEAA